ncbi:MAG: zinc metallopeptidase, partial [Verrucomicrobiota bacterium]
MDELLKLLSELTHRLPWIGAGLALALALGAALRLRVADLRQRGLIRPMNMSGGRVARQLLDRNGMANVEILPAKRGMGEAYRSDLRALFFSEANFRSHSPVAVAVAIHETGHAIQIRRQHWDVGIRFLLLHWTPLLAAAAWVAFLVGADRGNETRRRAVLDSSSRKGLEFSAAKGSWFAGAVLVIMLSEQTFFNAGPLLVSGTAGAAA